MFKSIEDILASVRGLALHQRGSHYEDGSCYRDIFEFRHIGPRIEVQSDPSQTRHGGLDDLTIEDEGHGR